MVRCLFLLLVATLIVTIASSRRLLDSPYYPTYPAHAEYSEDNSSRLTKRAAVASSASSEEIEESPNVDSAEEPSPKEEKTPVDESSSDVDSAEESSSNAEINPAFKSSSDSDSAEESPKSEEEVSPTRRRRSANEVRNKNLENLATICPTKKLEILEEGSFLDVKIEIRDMYKLCKDLPNRHH